MQTATMQTITKDEQCAVCGYYRGHHSTRCKHKTVEELRKDLETMHALAKRNQTACDIQLRRLKEHVTLWQGKFHALRHENNKLRRRLARQEKEDA